MVKSDAVVEADIVLLRGISLRPPGGGEMNAEGRGASDQGLTLVHFSAQCKRFLGDMACV